MSPSRRQLLLTGLAAALGGCATPKARVGARTRPTPSWPGAVAPPSAPVRQVQAAPVLAPARPADVAAKPASLPGVTVVPRDQWARYGANTREIHAMAGIQRITLHHEGAKPVSFRDYQRTAEHLERLRRSHVGSRGWSDLGYHFVVDRAGRVWEGRSLAYQGAHVRDHNPHNVGVMLLGNFERQAPTRAQLRAAFNTVQGLKGKYGVPTRRVYTHRELVPTACPGRLLQAEIESARKQKLI
ncbi:MAG: peptidoglycan recognition family protein [Planctomycetota bacterium]